MALPSSPPLRADSDLELLDIPSSPPLPPTLALPAMPHGRKRQLSEYDSNLSSDPLFSDDTTDNEDLAAYDRPRRKRMIQGPWYSMGKRPVRDVQEAMYATPKGHLHIADSGVFMGSDGSEESSTILLQSQQKLQALHVRERAEDATTGERAAERIVNACVEDGKETIDLSHLDLEKLSSETLRPLHTLTRHTHVNHTQPPSEDQFSSFTPSIQLYLASNKLSVLPAELFRLQHIAVLSLRNNQLTEIPSAIHRLSLKELNIAGNQIRHLPWELLDLLNGKGEAKKVYIRPNPLLEPTTIAGPSTLPNTLAGNEAEGLAALQISSADDFEAVRQRSVSGETMDLRTELEMRLSLGRIRRSRSLGTASFTHGERTLMREEFIYLASSAVHYFHVDGQPWRKRAEPDEAYPARLCDVETAPCSASNAPSLFELVLKCAQVEYDVFNLPDDLPMAARTALETAAERLDFGNQACSTCGKAFVIPRAEWVEYWFVGSPSQAGLTQDSVLPFLRKVCSWTCATPSAVGTYRI
ncbi:leucine rich repeat domain protein [Zymoseptoria brevis]|uniref:Leucine rich repeat domain protein n=1 Tax=Zymoseptoria brevis TaxID=1047168 RepID=A0A0F4G9X0_9PEZI|nr:leucine rich repeat domain protein [Zymoseptoria brevis]